MACVRGRLGWLGGLAWWAAMVGGRSLVPFLVLGLSWHGSVWLAAGLLGWLGGLTRSAGLSLWSVVQACWVVLMG